jgi:hypothetical protein
MHTPLGRAQPRPKTPEWELAEFRRRAWVFDRVACIHVDQLSDDWERQVVVNIANRLYGKGAK